MPDQGSTTYHLHYSRFKHEYLT